MNNKIFIYGAPGAGKTSFSIALQKKLDYPLVEADYLREVVAQKEKTREEDLFVYVGTKEAFRHFGPLNEENVIKGLGAVRASMNLYVEKEIARYSGDLILEGAFLDPEKISGVGRMILVVTSDEDKHRSQYFAHREKTEENKETFKTSRMIQDYLIQEAPKYKVTIIENSTNIENLVVRLLI